LQLLLGKLVPYFCMGMFSMLLCAVSAVVLFDVPFRGSVWALVLLSSVFMLSALGQGLLISTTIRSQLAAAEAGLFSGFLPALLLSGFVFDINSMPYALQAVTLLLPARYFNVCLRTLFLAGDIWAVFLPCLLVMGLLAAALLLLVYKNLVKRLDV
ncbi:MAG: ABC transporter permease subunit, partial [Desulfovibrio sp.]|nr:ABC transporter permease subunit [Desulfovibrio sp.]